MGLFRRPAFSLALGANTLAFAGVYGIEVFVVQYFQLVLGSSRLRVRNPAAGRLSFNLQRT